MISIKFFPLFWNLPSYNYPLEKPNFNIFFNFWRMEKVTLIHSILIYIKPDTKASKLTIQQNQIYLFLSIINTNFQLWYIDKN